MVDFASFILLLWCKWLCFSRVKMSCKNKREGILLWFCKRYLFPSFYNCSYTFLRALKSGLCSQLFWLGPRQSGQGGRNQGQYSGMQFLHSASSKDAYTFKTSPHPAQGKLASVRNGEEETLQSYILGS